jgi:biopolymer transport protein ExbD
VVVEVAKDASIQINGQPVKESDLQTKLEDIFKTRATKVVFVKGDPDVDYRYVARAIDDAKGAGLDKVGIMTPKVEAGQ